MPVAKFNGKEIRGSSPKLSPGTRMIIEDIENETIRNLLLKGLHPDEVVEGWYYVISLEIVKDQRKRK